MHSFHDVRLFVIEIIEPKQEFFKKMGQSRPLFVYFRSFHIPIQMTNIQFEQYKLKKRR